MDFILFFIPDNELIRRWASKNTGIVPKFYIDLCSTISSKRKALCLEAIL